MAEDLKKKVEELQDEQLDEVSGGIDVPPPMNESNLGEDIPNVPMF